MKVSNLEERIHVLDGASNVMSIIKDIALSGLQEEAFYVLDIGDIVHKHQIWQEKMPRVRPYYGKKITNYYYESRSTMNVKFMKFCPIFQL